MPKPDQLPQVEWKSLYDIGDTVIMDGSKDIKAVIMSIAFHGIGRNVVYNCGWFHNGGSYSAHIEEWRILPWEE